MKPLFLSVEGINSFIEYQEIDFEEVSRDRIFCICGPTGSGKSTILDCIIIALFAPRNHNRGYLKEYVNTKCAKGEIVFRFSYESGIYEVKRVLKESGTGGYLRRLDTGEELASLSESATEKIKEMLKMDEGDFTKVVVLEQGKFAKFITEKPTARYEFLSKLFNFDRFSTLKSKFNELVKKHTERVDDLNEKLEDLKEYTRGELEALGQREGRLLGQAETLRIESEELTLKRIELEKRKAEFTALQNARVRETEALTALEGAKSDKLKLEELNGRIEVQKASEKECGEREKIARENLSKIEECERDCRELLQKNIGRENCVERYKVTLKLHKELERSVGGNSAEVLEVLLAKLNAEREEVMKGNAAAAVVSLLKEGDDCPVCGGVFKGFAASGESGRLEALKREIDRVAVEQRSVAADAVKLAKTETELANIIGEGERIRGEIEQLRGRIFGRVGDADLERLKAEAETDIALLGQAKKRLEELNLEHGILSGEHTARRAAAEEKLNQARAEAARLTGARYDEAEEVRLAAAAAENLEAARLAGDELSGVRGRLMGYEKRLEQKKQFSEQKKKADEDKQNASILKKTFERNSFLEFVSREYIMGFTEAASGILSGLTDGKYTLEYEPSEKEFLVRDFLANNETRKVKTLSGGETFLASMSVAIAISREIAADKNYEFFFLDEGFGTLHEKAIDTVAEALKKLSLDTIVGLVSHRSELTERIASRLIISPATEERGSVINFVCG